MTPRDLGTNERASTIVYQRFKPCLPTFRTLQRQGIATNQPHIPHNEC